MIDTPAGPVDRVDLRDRLERLIRSIGREDARFEDDYAARLGKAQVAGITFFEAANRLPPDERARLRRLLADEQRAFPELRALGHDIVGKRVSDDDVALSLGVKTYRELREELGDRQTEFLLPDFVGASQFGLLAGPPKSGKSLAMYAMIGSFLAGGRFAHRTAVRRPVLLVQSEETWDTVSPRLRSAGIRARDEERLFLADYWGHGPHVEETASFNVNNAVHRRELRAQIERIAVDTGDPPVVFLDSLSHLGVGSERADTDEVGRACYALSRIASATRTAIIAVAHTRKPPNGARRQRTSGADVLGSVRQTAAAAFTLMIDGAGKGTSTLRATEMRAAPIPDPVRFRIVDDGIQWIDEATREAGGDGAFLSDVVAVVRSEPGTRWRQASIADRIAPNAKGVERDRIRNRIGRELRKAIDRGEIDGRDGVFWV